MKLKIKPKNCNSLFLSLSLILCSLISLVAVSLFTQNRQLTQKIIFLNENINTKEREKNTAVSVEQIRSTAEVIDWTLTKDDLSINKKYKISFRYPAKLISSARSMNGTWTYSFFESASKKDQYQKCILSKDPEINWEGSCSGKYLLFYLHISENDGFNINQHTSEVIQLENGNHQVFTTSPDAFGGQGDSMIFGATTVEQNRVFRVDINFPSVQQSQNLESIVGVDSFTFFKKLLSTLEFD